MSPRHPSALPLDSESRRTTLQKPHKGRIKDWRFEVWGGQRVVVGTFLDHKSFAGEYGHTSYVVSHDKATGEIETRNSRYTLVPREEADDKVATPWGLM